MSAMLDADEASYARLVERRWASANVTGLVAVPLAAGIMVIDYRLMLLSLIVLSLLLLAVIEAVRAGHAQRVDRNTNPEPVQPKRSRGAFDFAQRVDRNTNPEPVQPERSRGPALKPAEGDPSTPRDERGSYFGQPCQAERTNCLFLRCHVRRSRSPCSGRTGRQSITFTVSRY